MSYIFLLLGAALLHGFSLLVYLKCNHGMARNARGQQGRRLLFASLLAVAPLALSVCWDVDVASCPSAGLCSMLLTLVVGLLWMLTFPLLFHLTNRRTSPDYENYMDIAFGLYAMGWLWGLKLLLGIALPAWLGNAISPTLLKGLLGFSGVLLGLVEFVLLLAVLFQWVYYILYKVCIDTNGMKILQETHVNEVIEFIHSYGLWRSLLVGGIVLALACLTVWTDYCGMMECGWLIVECNVWSVLAMIGVTLFLLIYTWKTHHGVFGRTGLAKMFSEVKEYVTNNRLYTAKNAERMAHLDVKPLGKPWSRPSTIVMVIGESACRDFMSAFTPMDEDTTPWLRGLAEDKRHTLLFPHAYSCAMQTVPALEKALTEYNQYGDRPFYESCSIVDIAHKLGYRVHWYSNQGHLGVADTPITLVADTSDVAKWTKQEVNKVQYDEELVSFLDEIDPTQNNFVVLHLKGSHFNYMSRYPRSFTRWGKPGVQENVTCYKNSIAYTDHVLQQFFEYSRQRLNLQAMLYFSDHATEPGRRRKPNFNGFQMTRIPMFVWLSDEYIGCHPQRYEALMQNHNKFFTNDLAYELVCGLLDVESSRFDESASLASSSYRFTRDMLLTYEGKKHIAEDQEERI